MSNTDYREFILECLTQVKRASIDVMLRAYLCISWDNYIKALPQPASLMLRDNFRDVAESLVKEGILKKEIVPEACLYSIYQSSEASTSETGHAVNVVKKSGLGLN